MALFSRNHLLLPRIFQKSYEHEEHQSFTKIFMRILVGTVSSRGSQISSWLNLIVPKFFESIDLGFCNISYNRPNSSYNPLFHKPIVSRCSTWKALPNAHKHEGNGDIRNLTLIWRQWRFMKFWCSIPWNRWTRSCKKLNTKLRFEGDCFYCAKSRFTIDGANLYSHDLRLFSIQFAKTVTDDDEWRSTQKKSCKRMKNWERFGQFCVMCSWEEFDEFGEFWIWFWELWFSVMIRWWLWIYMIA